jgi:hypothetical protein
MKSLSQYIEKYNMGHYDLFELMCALSDSVHFDTIGDVCDYLEDEMFDEFEMTSKELLSHYDNECCKL